MSYIWVIPHHNGIYCSAKPLNLALFLKILSNYWKIEYKARQKNLVRGERNYPWGELKMFWMAGTGLDGRGWPLHGEGFPPPSLPYKASLVPEECLKYAWDKAEINSIKACLIFTYDIPGIYLKYTWPKPEMYLKDTWYLSEIYLRYTRYYRLSSIKGCPPPMIVFHWRSSSTDGHLPPKDVFHQR